MKVGVIVDGKKLAYWQARALETLSLDADFFVYSCSNARSGTRRSRHYLYYLLNLFTIRNHLTGAVDLPTSLSGVGIREFHSGWDGIWQTLPPEILQRIVDDGAQVLIKFGMGLLRVPSVDALPIPILSYHHGEPREFRGRPAGFYELLHGQPTMGQVVQVLSNTLDAGEIVAWAQTNVVTHSYRATLIESYRHSPLLLRPAIESVLSGKGMRLDRKGRIYQLPSNRTVIRFVLKLAAGKIARLGYGLFREKAWKVATIRKPASASLPMALQMIRDEAAWVVVPTPPNYRFIADPFFYPGGDLVVEAFETRSNRGQLVSVNRAGARRISGAGGHFSYPANVQIGGEQYVFPETADWAAARAYRLTNIGLGEAIELRLPGWPRLIDPTPYWTRGMLYLFGNVLSEGGSVLRLWVARDLRGDFTEHPASPIRISPLGSRMGGNLIEVDGKLIRVGQDLRRAYGDGLCLFQVTMLAPDEYSEEIIAELRLKNVRGPHTLNLASEEVVFDYYTDRFSPFAGLRRLKARRAASRIRD